MATNIETVPAPAAKSTEQVSRRPTAARARARLRPRRLRFQFLLVLAAAVPRVLLHRRARAARRGCGSRHLPVPDLGWDRRSGDRRAGEPHAHALGQVSALPAVRQHTAGDQLHVDVRAHGTRRRGADRLCVRDAGPVPHDVRAREHSVQRTDGDDDPRFHATQLARGRAHGLGVPRNGRRQLLHAAPRHVFHQRRPHGRLLRRDCRARSARNGVHHRDLRRDARGFLDHARAGATAAAQRAAAHAVEERAVHADRRRHRLLQLREHPGDARAWCTT